jgi:hypothetical protein
VRPFFDPTAYRYPHEQLILGLTLTLVFLVIAFTATATLCSSALFVIFIVTLSYATSRAQHQALVARAQPVTSQTTPGFANLVREIVSRLQVSAGFHHAEQHSKRLHLRPV